MCIYLIFDGSDGTVITPVEIGGKIVGREDRSLLSVVGKPETPHAEIVPAEFRRREIGELSDAVDGGGVELLVPFGAAQVSLEDAEPVIVLLRRGVGLTEPRLERREVVFGA